MAPAAAATAAHKPSLRSQFNPYNFWVCFLVSLGQVAFGYPASVIGVTLAQPPFLVYMGLVDENGPTENSEALIGTMNGLFQAGAVLGILSASYIMDGWGRKAGVLYCSFFSLVGGALLCGSRNVGMFIAARFIAGWGSWGFLAVSKLELVLLLLHPLFILSANDPEISGDSELADTDTALQHPPTPQNSHPRASAVSS